MSKPKLTDEEKKHLKMRNAFRFMRGSVSSAWSQGELQSWSDFYKKCGLPIDTLLIEGRAFNWEGCKCALGAMENKLEERIKNELKPVQEPLTILEAPTIPSEGNKEAQAQEITVQEEHPKDKQEALVPEEITEKAYCVKDFLIESDPTSTEEVSAPSKSQAIIEALGDAQECEVVVEQPVAETVSGKKIYHSDNIHDVTPPAIEYNEANNYGFTPSPEEDPNSWYSWYQKKAISESLQKLVVEKKTGILILAPTGSGKTYIMKGILRRLIDMGYHEDKCFSHIPYLLITRATVVEQIERAIKQDNVHPNEEVTVCNIEQLRSSKGAYWVKREMKVVDVTDDGTPIEQEIFKWKKMLNPCVLFFDESQSAKNKQSSQSQIIYAYNDLDKNAQLVSVSATPFTKVIEAQAFAVSTHRPLEHLGFPPGSVLTNDTWPAYAKAIADPDAPSENSPQAIKRLMKDLEPWVVRVKGVNSQFKALNKIERISFETPVEAQFYAAAWDRFLEEKRKKEEDVDGDRFMFVILLKFAMAAEECRVNILARKMYESVQSGHAAVCACKFKTTIIKIVMILTDLEGPYKVDRDNISLVWGGGQTQLTAKQKAKAKVKAIAKKMAAMSEDGEVEYSEAEMMEAMDLEEVEDRELFNIPPELRLESQDKVERQSEIDKFQSGRSLYCLFTFRAGGVGLSLHHSDELTKEKCRRKKSGYVYEEDIPSIPVRPRETFLAPTYSAIELVQGLGRAPRLTSLSNTNQTLLFYRGTIEDDIADIVSSKLRCLGEVVKQKESWQDVICGGNTQKYLSDEDQVPDEESGELEVE